MGKIKNINWEKGFLRIWVVGSVGWVLLITWFYIEDRQDAYGSIPFSDYLIFAFGWPIGILVFAYAAKFLIKFIIQGFK